MLNVKAHYRTITKRHQNDSLLGRVAKRNNIAVQLRFVKLHLNKPQDICNIVLCKKTKTEMFSQNAKRNLWHDLDDDLGLFCNHMTWVSCCPRINHEHKFEAICLTAKDWLRMDHAT